MMEVAHGEIIDYFVSDRAEDTYYFIIIYLQLLNKEQNKVFRSVY